MAYNSFLGRHECKMDAKNRIVVPSFFRSELDEEFIICRGFDNCLYVMDKNRFDIVSYQIAEDLQFSDYSKASRRLHSNAYIVKADKQGRIIVPPSLRDIIGLQEGTLVTLLGAGLYVEVWRADVIREKEAQEEDDDLEELKSRIKISGGRPPEM